MNSAKIAAALRILANAFDDGEVPAEPAQPAADKPKRGRGRPVQGEESAAPAAQPSTSPTATPASSGADPFETAPAAPVATLDEVRTALKALAAAVDQATALGVLKTAGGAANLTELKAEKYGAVVQAATAALPPVKTEAAPVEADPFDAPAPAATKPVTLEDVKAVIVETQKRTSQDTVQKAVMAQGGKAAVAGGGEQPSLKALPEANYAATIAALKALPTTK
jgi:hypothetical protein